MAAEDTAGGAALSLQNITKRYGDFVAARDLCIDIEPGEFVTLLGPSGSGKTTTLNMIAGFIDISDGEILLDGRPIGVLRLGAEPAGSVNSNRAGTPVSE